MKSYICVSLTALSLTALSAWGLENVFQTVDQTLIKRSFHVHFSLI